MIIFFVLTLIIVSLRVRSWCSVFTAMSTFMTTLSNPWLVLTLAGLLPLLYYLIRVCLVNGVACKSKKRLDGKTVIITGGNTGIGYETALELAHRGARIIIACRDKTRGENAVLNVRNESENDNVLFRKLDLASCTSIHTFASKILTEESQIDILICNAGVMFTPYCLTEDGFEMQFGTNHLGHFLLTNLLLDRLKESSPSRVVVVASLAHMAGYLDFNDMMWTKKYNPQLSYCRSKLANVMFARELSKRVAGSGVTVCSLHPGTVYTEITRHLLSGWLIVLKVNLMLPTVIRSFVLIRVNVSMFHECLVCMLISPVRRSGTCAPYA